MPNRTIQPDRNSAHAHHRRLTEIRHQAPLRRLTQYRRIYARHQAIPAHDVSAEEWARWRASLDNSPRAAAPCIFRQVLAPIACWYRFPHNARP